MAALGKLTGPRRGLNQAQAVALQAAPEGCASGRAQRASAGFLEMRLVMSMGRCASWGWAAPLYTCVEEGSQEEQRRPVR